MGLSKSSVPSNPPVISFRSWNGRCYPPLSDIPWYTHIISYINGNPRILKWRYCTIAQAIFCWDIHWHSPYIGLIYMVGTSILGSWNSHWIHTKKTTLTNKMWRYKSQDCSVGDPSEGSQLEHSRRTYSAVCKYALQEYHLYKLYIYIYISYIHLEFSILLTAKNEMIHLLLIGYLHVHSYTSCHQTTGFP